MNKKLIKNLSLIVIAVIAVFSVAKIGTSLAYFFADKNHESTYQLAVIDSKIDEEFKQESVGRFLKNPKIQNIGKDDCIIRVRIEVTPSQQEVLLEGLEGNEKWIFNQEDGYYYYQGVVAPNEKTTELFHHVVIQDVENMENFDIIVYNEAIQTVAYDDNKEMSSLDENGTYNQENALKLWKYYR